MAFIIDNFSTLYNSKVSLKTLREKILDLAIQGRIVPYAESDGTALEVLHAISNAKEYLSTIKKHKLHDAQLPISLNEIPFEIPENWVWKRLGDLVSNRTGLTYNKDNLMERSLNMVRVLRGGNIDDLGYKFLENDIMISSQFVKDELYLCRNDLITPAVSSIEQIGKMARIEKDYHDTVVGGFVLVLKPYFNDDIHARYLLYTLSSHYHRENCRAITNKSGQAFYNLSREKMLNLLIPVPPHLTQQRIVQRIEELYTLCDNLEDAIAHQKAYHGKLPKAVVDAIGSSSTSEDLRRNLLFVLDNFKTIFQEADSMKELRNVVLQLAIEGKLVPQDESDEPASVLLKKIQGEKERLVREKKTKKVEPLAPVAEDETPFEIPGNWCWTRLGIVCDVRDGTHDTPRYVDHGIPLVTSKNLDNGKINISNIKYITHDDHLRISQRSGVDDGDILFAMIGSIGNPVIVKKTYEFSIKNMALIKNNTRKYLDINYVNLYLLRTQESMKSISSGGVQSFVSLTFLRDYLFPIPPVVEQHRIVNKVDAIMKLIDQMENELKRKTDIVTKMVAVS